MAQTIPNPPAGFDELTIDERLDYVQSLWDLIAAKPEEIEVPDWHREILDQRLAEFRAHPEKARPWEAVRADLRRKLDEHRKKS